MRKLIALCITLLIAALYLGCADDVTTYRSAITGDECIPNSSLMARETSDDRDDERSGKDERRGKDGRRGKGDCHCDGNSDHGDDKKDHCQFPQPGCDDQGCCETDDPDPDVPEPDAGVPDPDDDVPPIP